MKASSILLLLIFLRIEQNETTVTKNHWEIVKQVYIKMFMKLYRMCRKRGKTNGLFKNMIEMLLC